MLTYCVPNKIRELLRLDMKAGAEVDAGSGNGSHRKIKHPNLNGCLIISGKDGDDAKRYQEKDLETFLKIIKK